MSITLLRPIAMFCGTDNIMRNILHIQYEYSLRPTHANVLKEKNNTILQSDNTQLLLYKTLIA